MKLLFKWVFDMGKWLRFVLLVCLMSASSIATSRMPDEAFSAVRAQVSKANQKSPIAGIEKADELLQQHDHELLPAQRIRLFYLKSWYQINADRIEQALATLAEARLLARDIEEPGILYSYYSISASAFSNVELYELALESNLNAYDQAPLLGRPEFIRQTENNIGHIYLKLGLLDEAEYYFQRFYESSVQLQQPSQTGTGLNNLGEVAYLRGDLVKAHALHSEALALRQEHGFEYHEAFSRYNLGRVFAAQAQFQEAEQNLQQAISKWQSQGAFSKTLEPKIALVKAYSAQQRLDAASALATEIIDFSRENKLYIPLQEALLLQSNLKRRLGDLSSALAALDQYNVVTKQFAQKQTAIGLAYMVSQTELQTKEMALKQLEQEHQLTLTKAEAQRRQGWISLLSALVIITLTWAFMYRLARRKKQLQTLLEQLESTQAKLVESEKMRAMTTLVSGMAHQLNTPLGLVITANSTLQSQVEKLAEQFAAKSLTQKRLAQFIDESVELLALSQNNSEKAANMIQRFKMMSAKLQMTELSQFALMPFLEENVGGLETLKQQNIQLQVSGENVQISNYASVLLKVMIQLVENSIKHGFSDTLKPVIRIKVEIKEDEHVVIHYMDNGSGIPRAKRKEVFNPFYTTRLGEGSLGLGLNVIYNSVVHLMHGQVECVEDAEGAHFVIKIPQKVRDAKIIASGEAETA